MLHPLPHQSAGFDSAVEFRGVTCGYDGRVVLESIDLRILPNDFVGVLGPSGSGKTTLLRAILGAVKIQAGSIHVEGSAIRDRRPQVGYVPQLETIDWTFPVTVEEAVMMGRTRNTPLLPWFGREDRQKAHELMERLGIADLRSRHIRELSGGQQQRVFLTRALLSNPRLLLLDEPTSGVDMKTRDDILHLLHELNHQGVTIIMATHEINAVAAHLPWVVCLNGRVVAEGPPSEVVNPGVLKATYGVEMPVIHHDGMVLVTERPHFVGRNGSRAATHAHSDHNVRPV